MLSALACLAIAAAPPDGFDPAEPQSWTLAARLTPDNPEYAKLVKDLTSKVPASEGEAYTEEEVERLFRDPRADYIYGVKTVSVFAPSQPSKHRQEHLDLVKLLLTPERLRAGEDFLVKYRGPLQRAEAIHGVPAKVIVSILMWESKLGAVTGDWRTFNVFTSQAFFAQEANRIALSRPGESNPDPARQERRLKNIRERAYKNLLALLRQCKKKLVDPLEVRGSWAGALGYPQFMPASLRYAEDGNMDGIIDLYNFEDAIFSVARYLSEHGWARDNRKAVFRYNNDSAYVEGVLAYADALGVRPRPTPADVAPEADAGTDSGIEDGGRPAP